MLSTFNATVLMLRRYMWSSDESDGKVGWDCEKIWLTAWAYGNLKK